MTLVCSKGGQIPKYKFKKKHITKDIIFIIICK